MLTPQADETLRSRFEEQLGSRVPSVDESGKVVRATPLVDLTEALAASAREDYGFALPAGAKVFGKFDSKVFGGSVKVRPAISIISDAIDQGKLTPGKTVFEATSGNFGLALALLRKLDLRVVALVSRKLQPKVLEELQAAGVALINLDVDICPAPGMKGDADLLVAKGIASSVRQQLRDAGLDPAKFDGVRREAEELLARQDVISLAKLLASAYDGFCPEQYDNELNFRAHMTVTGPEIDQQLREEGLGFSDFDFVCALGTGGTATGLSRYIGAEQGRKAVHVVYPLPSQDVAGIRTKEKAAGLRFYLPGEYATERELDFDRVRKLQARLNGAGFDVGESGALALYGALGLIAEGRGTRFVVLIADGASKYATPQATAAAAREVTLQQATQEIGSYSAVVWTHSAVTPKEEGVKALASALGVGRETVRIAKVRDLQALMAGRGVPEVFSTEGPKKILLVCMVGGTSLTVARALAQKGVQAESLRGGITGIPAVRGRQPLEYLRQATE